MATDHASAPTRRRLRARALVVAGLLMTAALVALPATASSKTVKKRVPATVIFKSDVKPVNPPNVTGCGTVALVQWKDPTANRFVASRWEVHYMFEGTERVEYPVPPFNNRVSWFETTHIATGGNNWHQAGSVSGGVPDPPTATRSCDIFRQRVEARYAGPAWVIVSGEEDKGDTARCIRARKAYNTARTKVNAARRQLAAAETSAAKTRAKARLNSAIKTRAQAAAAVGRACNG